MSKFRAVDYKAPNQSLALSPPYFPSSTLLVDPQLYSGGIPNRALEGDLQCIISPWSAMAIGDKVCLYWHNLTTPVACKTIESEAEVNQPVVLWAPRNQVRDGDATPVFYQVERQHQAPERSTPLLTFLVKTTRPGGDDESPVPGHSGFRYRFMTDITNGVDAEKAKQGVQLLIEPYPHMTSFDRIICYWGNQKKTHYPVTQAQIDDPVKNPIVITFTQQDIEAAGNGTQVVTFQAFDRVGNYQDRSDAWAMFSYVQVDLGGHSLDAPLVLVNGTPTDTIILNQLGDKDLLTRVYTPPADFAVGDTVRLTYTGIPAQGSPVIVQPQEQKVAFVPSQLDFIIPNAAVKAIAKGWASLSYVRSRSGAVDQASKNLSASVWGNISRLPPPSVKQAPGGSLPSDSTHATITVANYEGRKTGDLITIHCEGRRPGGADTYHQIRITVADSDGNAPIERDLPASVIATLEGGALKVYYVVADDDLGMCRERESLPLQLNVGVTLPDFKQPEIGEADGNLLRPDKTPNGAVVIAPFNVPEDTRAGDTVGLRWVGSVTGAPPLYEISLTSQSAGKPVLFLVRPEHIHPNAKGMVTVAYYLKRASEMTRFSRQRVFSIGNALPEWEITSVTDARGEEIFDGATTVETPLMLAGRARNGETIDIQVNGVTQAQATADDATGEWEAQVSLSIAGQHSLVAKSTTSDGGSTRAWLVNIAPGLEDFESVALQPITEKPINLPAMKLSGLPADGNLSIAAASTTTSEINGHLMDVQMSSLESSITMDFKFIPRHFSMSCQSLRNGPGHSIDVDCYATDGTFFPGGTLDLVVGVPSHLELDIGPLKIRRAILRFKNIHAQIDNIGLRL